MQGRVSPFEDGKGSSQRTPMRAFPLRILKFLVLFVVLGVGVSILSFYMSKSFGIQSIVSQCFEEQGSLRRWVMPPSSLMHSMSDEELFWRASFAPQLKKYPYKRVPKVAFMFLTKGPLPLSPLWDKFFRGNEGQYSIYVHSLPDYRPNFALSSAFFRRNIPSQVAEWGRMSMCDAERRLLANALLDLNNERFVLLSESCIPLFNFSIVYQYLIHSKYSFLGSFDDPGPHGRGRYNERMAPEVNITNWRKGAQWFEVNRELAISLVQDTKYYPKFKEFCKPACYVDEHYFPTMLSIEAPHLIANRSLTAVDWSRGGAHPATFGGKDISEAFLRRVLEGQSCMYNDQPSMVCYLFARKFAPSTSDPLLKLAPSVLGFG